MKFLDGPVITRTRSYSASEALAPGTSVTLMCNVEANPLDLSSIRWFKNDQDLSMTNAWSHWERRFEGTEATLISKSVRKEDAGQYVCEIENPHGTSRATLSLVVQCKFESIREIPVLP